MTITDIDEFDAMFRIELPPRPYPGLRAFEKHEWPIFFGRERMSDAVVKRLFKKRLLVIHGDSGCGKSSLVRAGVLPRLEQENARGLFRWITSVTNPGDEPLWNVARSLATLGGPDPQDARGLDFLRAFNCGEEAPQRVFELLDLGPQDQLCILIDQFEEIFAHAKRCGSGDAKLLTQALVALYRNPPERLYVILTMRSEFLGTCARFDGFAEVVNETQYLVPRMECSELLRAIREPAALYGGEISHGLAARLIANVGGTQDELPLIQHGLMLLQLRGRMRVAGSGVSAGSVEGTALSWRLDIEQFQNAGGLSGLLSDHADEVMQRAEQAAGHEKAARLIENLFRELTDIDADMPAIRRPGSLDELARSIGCDIDVLRRIVDVFRADEVSFLRPGGSAVLEPNDLIDISHEALIRSWTRLANPESGWVLREFRDGLIWRTLLVQAEGYEEDPSNLLGPVATEERTRWITSRNPYWANRYGGGWERVQALLQASQEENWRLKAEQEEARARAEEARVALIKLKSARRVQWLLIGGLATTMALVFVSFSQYFGREKALRESELQRVAYGELYTTANKELSQIKASNSGNAELIDRIQEAQATLAAQARKPSAASTPLVPRVYIQITEESQRAQAKALQSLLMRDPHKTLPLTVPGIELKPLTSARSELRCFRADECEDTGRKIVEEINALLISPQVELVDLSKRYQNSEDIRPQHFELWFAKGAITTRPD